MGLRDLGKLVNVVQGEPLDLSTLANEVTTVSLEVGTKGILGGQAFVPEVQGFVVHDFTLGMRR